MWLLHLYLKYFLVQEGMSASSASTEPESTKMPGFEWDHFKVNGTTHILHVTPCLTDCSNRVIEGTRELMSKIFTKVD